MPPTHRRLLSSSRRRQLVSFFFFFNDTATTEIYTLSLHDALPIFAAEGLADALVTQAHAQDRHGPGQALDGLDGHPRSEEHTSELQSQSNLVCRLLLEKKKRKIRRFRFDRCISTTLIQDYLAGADP